MKTIITALLVSACILIGTGCKRNSAPATPGAPVGPAAGMVGESLNFLVVTTDPESDSVRYRVDWGDTVGEWTGLSASAESCAVSHTWFVRNAYAVRVQAEDEHGMASEWSPPYMVSIESLCRR
jgi:hypothetical protein